MPYFNAASRAQIWVHLGLFTVGLVTLFIGTALAIGISQRTPATITLTSESCELLPGRLSSPAEGGCRVHADDYIPGATMTDLWFFDRDNLLNGSSISVPTRSIRISYTHESHVPLWVTGLPFIGLLLTFVPLVSFGMLISKKN